MAVWTSYGRGRSAIGEADVILAPRLYRADASTLGVVYCHGGMGDALSASDPVEHAGEWALVRGIAEVHPVVVADLGGLSNFGNSTAVARIDEARRYLQTAWGARPGPVALVGVSMGGIAALNYAARYPGFVTTVDGIMPVNDLRNVYLGSGGNLKPYIDEAYGITSVSGIPKQSDPTQNFAALAGLDYHAWYGSNDDICLPHTITNLVALLGPPAVATDLGPYFHDQAGIEAVPVDQVLAHLASAA